MVEFCKSVEVPDNPPVVFAQKGKLYAVIADDVVTEPPDDGALATQFEPFEVKTHVEVAEVEDEIHTLVKHTPTPFCEIVPEAFKVPSMKPLPLGSILNCETDEEEYTSKLFDAPLPTRANVSLSVVEFTITLPPL